MNFAPYRVFTKIHFVSGFSQNINRKTGVYREIYPGESSGKQISWGNISNFILLIQRNCDCAIIRFQEKSKIFEKKTEIHLHIW